MKPVPPWWSSPRTGRSPAASPPGRDARRSGGVVVTAVLAAPRAARLRPADVARVGAAGLKARPVRAFLAALGIAIGIAAMVAVVGISTSSRADLQRTLDRLGTNLLTVAPGSTIFGGTAELPDEAVSMIARIGPVLSASATGRLADAQVYRSDRMPKVETGGLSVQAGRPHPLGTVGATHHNGVW